MDVAALVAVWKRRKRVGRLEPERLGQFHLHDDDDTRIGVGCGADATHAEAWTPKTAGTEPGRYGYAAALAGAGEFGLVLLGLLLAVVS